MRSLRLLLAVLLAGAFSLVIVPSPAYACSCAQTSVAKSLKDSDVVFRGRFVDGTPVSRGEQRVDLRFEVDAVYKGTAFSDQLVSSSDNSASCGFSPEAGTTWIVFAAEGFEGVGDKTVTRLNTNLCSGNLPSGSAPRVLGEARDPVDGPSDREEKTVVADQRLSQGLAYAGIGALFLGSLAVLGLIWLWRPGRRR